MGRDDIVAIELAAFEAWPPIEVERIGGWRLHASGRLHRRLNSANATRKDPGRLPMDKVEAWYRNRGLPPIVRITPLVPNDLDATLAGSGYRHVAPTNVLVTPITQTETEGVVVIVSEVSDEWLEAKLRLAYRDAIGMHHVAEHAIRNSGPEPGYAHVRRDGSIVAVGLGVRSNDLTGVFGVTTHPDHRGSGYGTAITESLMAWGRDRGASTAYLQVEVDNPSALRVYERLGFSVVYRYHYRVLT